MRELPGRAGATAGRANSRLALAALGLAVGTSIALGAGAVRVLTRPLAPQAQQAAPARAMAPAAQSVPPPVAGEQGDQNVANDRGSHELSRAQAIALVQRRYHARVVRTAVLRGPAGRHLYVFRLLSASGRVWTVRIDAHTGAEVQ